MKKWRLILLSVIIFRKLLTDNFIHVKDNGELNPDTSFAENKDGTFNSWNLDLRYSWWFLLQVHNSLYCIEIKLKIS